ncbi:PepSY-associated TM helix domain-containing protein, partial [Acinetobacter variabilis]
FRPGKGQRSWLDAHNATAVFALPFHIMITFSGLLLLLFTIMPWGVNQIYENRGAFLQDQRKTLIQDNGQEAESRAGRS